LAERPALRVMGPHRPPTAKGQQWEEEGGGGEGHMGHWRRESGG